VGPAYAGIGTGHNNVLPGESKGPYLRCVRVIDARLYRFRTLEVRRRIDGRPWLRKLVVDFRIAFNPRYVRPRRQRFGHLQSSLHQNRINNIKGLMFDAAFAQPLQNRILCCLGFVLKSLVYEPPLFSLGREIRGRAEVGLVGKHDEKFRLLAIRGVFHHPRRELAPRCRSAQWHLGLTCQCAWLC
jgi:hypothetical protein